MRTLIGVNDPQAVKKWASLMAVAINKESYWSRKFVGNGKDSRLPIQRIDDLQQGAGDEVTVDLLMPINQEPIIVMRPWKARKRRSSTTPTVCASTRCAAARIWARA